MKFLIPQRFHLYTAQVSACPSDNVGPRRNVAPRATDFIDRRCRRGQRDRGRQDETLAPLVEFGSIIMYENRHCLADDVRGLTYDGRVLGVLL